MQSIYLWSDNCLVLHMWLDVLHCLSWSQASQQTRQNSIIVWNQHQREQEVILVPLKC